MESRIKARIESGREWTLSWDGKGIGEEVKGQVGLEPEVILGSQRKGSEVRKGLGYPIGIMEPAVMWE